jgi:hypothetical protein
MSHVAEGLTALSGALSTYCTVRNAKPPRAGRSWMVVTTASLPSFRNITGACSPAVSRFLGFAGIGLAHQTSRDSARPLVLNAFHIARVAARLKCNPEQIKKSEYAGDAFRMGDRSGCPQALRGGGSTRGARRGRNPPASCACSNFAWAE